MSDHVLGPGKDRHDPPFKKRAPWWAARKEVVIIASGAWMGRVLMGNPASAQGRGLSQAGDKVRGAHLHGHMVAYLVQGNAMPLGEELPSTYGFESILMTEPIML